MKEPLKFYLDRQIYNLREKQLKDKELLFKDQCKKVEKDVNGWESKFDGEKELFIVDFSTSKG